MSNKRVLICLRSKTIFTRFWWWLDDELTRYNKCYQSSYARLLYALVIFFKWKKEDKKETIRRNKLNWSQLVTRHGVQITARCLFSSDKVNSFITPPQNVKGNSSFRCWWYYNDYNDGGGDNIMLIVFLYNNKLLKRL